MLRRLLMLGGALCCGLLPAAQAENIKLAVAANFMAPVNDIIKQFLVAHPEDSVDLSTGSSGHFATEITNGAPYAVFLSADIDHAQQLEKAGLTVPGSRFTYAVGHLVLYSANPALVDDQGKIVARGIFTHVAIADPKEAPYGLAAQQYLQNAGQWGEVYNKLVIGKSIAQTLQFITSGNAELGFVALSQVIDKPGGSRWLVPDSTHAPITQQAVLLKTAADSVAAKQFLDFLKSPAAQAVITRYGYSAK